MLIRDHQGLIARRQMQRKSFLGSLALALSAALVANAAQANSITVLNPSFDIKSLRTCPEHALLNDHGDALQLALTDGGSRYGSGTKHGHGFRPIFVGLSILNGFLRFRSGDHALTIEGRDPKQMPWKKSAKPPISGFLASISCTLRATTKAP